MSTSFQWITPGDANGVAKAVSAEQSAVSDAVFDAISLADSAAAFFRGVFPVETPHFWWGESIPLPWHEEYWDLPGDGTSIPRSIGREAASIAETLAESATGETNHQPWPQATYMSEVLSKTDKLMMQGLAVETMLSVDGFLNLVSKGSAAESLVWLSAAYKNIVECTCLAQRILGYARENARLAAHARHKENYEMKAQVWEWYSKHRAEFRSLDKAAQAVIGEVKLVPVTFRTAREWIGQLVKHERYARRP